MLARCRGKSGAILFMDSGPDFDVSAAADVIADRIAAIPRLRQVIVRAPPGCGRPVWVDDADFDVNDHLQFTACDPPGDEPALLEMAVALVTQRLPSDHPLWRATFITGLAGSRIALLIVFHHVVADGIGGLAVLANLVDGAPIPAAVLFPRRRSGTYALARCRRQALASARATPPRRGR